MSFPRNHKDSFEPLKTLWKSTMGIQPPSTLATFVMEGYTKGAVRIFLFRDNKIK